MNTDGVARSEHFFAPFWRSVAPQLHCNDADFLRSTMAALDELDLDGGA